MADILVVDDDSNIRKLISTFLSRKGYNPECAKDGAEALEMLCQKPYDLVIADVMMPEVDGYKLTYAIRSLYDALPVLMVTARDGFEDKGMGFKAGTDDYMVKPINLDELSIRVAALLRRAAVSGEKKLTLGCICVNLDSRIVATPDETVELPRREFDLFIKLISNPGRIFTRKQLMDEIWGMDADADERTVDVHIKRLREKFERYDEFEIKTIRGLGYKTERRV